MDPTLSHRSSAAIFPGKYPRSRVENFELPSATLVSALWGIQLTGKDLESQAAPLYPWGISLERWESQHKRGKGQGMDPVFLSLVPGFCWIFRHTLKLILCIFHYLAKWRGMPYERESELVWTKLYDLGKRTEDWMTQLLTSQSCAVVPSPPFHCTYLNRPSVMVIGWGEFPPQLYFFSFSF